MRYSGSYRQAERRFRGPEYEYLKPTDGLPDDHEIGTVDAGGWLSDPVLRIRLHVPGNGPAFYVVTATSTGEGAPPVVFGCYVSRLGRYYDAWDHLSIAKLAARRSAGRPLQRDLAFRPARLSVVRRGIAIAPPHLAAANG